MATKLTPLQQAEAELKARQKALDQGQLDAIDLPTLFESAAKQANPNYGLSRVELLAKYNAPEYSDTTSSNYIDPTTRIAMADRLASGYQGVLGQATDRASALFGRDLSAKEQAANRAKSQYDTLNAEDLRQRTRAEALQDYEKQKQIDLRYRPPSGSGDLTTLQLLGLQQNNPLGLAQLKGYTREAAPNGGKGYWFYKNNPDGTRVPVTVDEVANAIGGNKTALLEGSTNAGDQKLLQQASGKPPTMTQETTGLYASRIKQANDIFDQLSNYTAGLNPVTYTAQQKLPGFLNALRSGNFQSLDQAQRNFVNAVLRRESGAVISPAEFENAKLQYFPQPGDKPEVLAQKKANRELVQRQFIQGAGAAYNGDTAGSGQTDEEAYQEYLRLTGQQPR